MKLSILIPMYNASKYIGNCLDSLLNQDIPKGDYEIIIMDDGSTDNSVDIVNTLILKTHNITLFKEENSGLYTTRNKLLKLAKGEYIYNIDADDYIAHGCLNNILNMALEHNVDIIAFDTILTQNLKLLNFDGSSTIFPLTTGIGFFRDFKGFRYEIWWYFIKRSFLLTTKLNFNSNEYNGDVIFTLRLLVRAQKMIYLKAAIHRYVQTQDSIMRSGNSDMRLKQIDNMFQAIIDFSDFINSLNINNHPDIAIVLNNLKSRRDALTFFTLIKKIRNKTTVEGFNSQIEALANVDAYPIRNFIGKEYNSLNYKMLTAILNNKRIFVRVIILYNFINPLKFNFLKRMFKRRVNIILPVLLS